MLLVGCVEPNRKPSKPQPKTSTLEQIAFDSFQKRDTLRGERLLKLADDIEAGKVKYDKPIMQAWSEIGATSSEESWKPVAEAAAKQLDTGEFDAKKAAEATRSIGRASLKAGK